MNSELIRLTAAVVAGSDPETAERIRGMFDGETQEELRAAVQSFKSTFDVRDWRKVMSASVVRRLYQECAALSDAEREGAIDPVTEKSRFDGMGLGDKSIRSLERILERMAVPEGAG